MRLSDGRQAGTYWIFASVQWRVMLPGQGEETPVGGGCYEHTSVLATLLGTSRQWPCSFLLLQCGQLCEQAMAYFT